MMRVCTLILWIVIIYRYGLSQSTFKVIWLVVNIDENVVSLE